MKFYNNINGLFVILIIFSIFIFILGKSCPCDNIIRKHCRRLEIFGALYSHIFLFIILGYFFPNYFILLMISGIIWEILEHIINLKYSDYIIKNNFGCLSLPPKDTINKNIYNEVYRNNKNYINQIDKYFNLTKSSTHMWYGSIADIIANIIGFIIGYYINIYFK